MVTKVGTESAIQDLVQNLLSLEHDAIAAHDSPIDKLQDPTAKQRISSFREDHLRHVQKLRKMNSMLHIEAPMEGDAGQMLTAGTGALAGLIGESAVLKSLKTNKDDTVTAYERASSHADAAPESRRLFSVFADDERRHRAWLDRAASARDGLGQVVMFAAIVFSGQGFHVQGFHAIEAADQRPSDRRTIGALPRHAPVWNFRPDKEDNHEAGRIEHRSIHTDRPRLRWPAFF